MFKDRQIIKLNSNLTELYRVEKFVEDICDEYDINNTYFGNILIALTEAVENAIKHGNKNNPDKIVSIIFEACSVGLSFTVIDEGNGFNIKNISDPTDISETVNPCEGQGIYLMKSLADDVNFGEKGNSIELIFKITSINNELSNTRINQLKKYTEVKPKKYIKNN